MSTAAVAAAYESCARAALPAYGIAPDAVVEELNVSENGTYLVREESGLSVLRVHRAGYHSETAIRSELAWVDALREADAVRTPAHLPALDGSQVVLAHGEHGSHHVVRFEHVRGTEPGGDNLVASFEQLGAITARLHEHARSWQPPAWFTRFTWDYETTLGPRPHWGRWRDGLGMGTPELRVLEQLDACLRERLAAYGTGPDRFGLVHADTRLANLLVHEGEVTVIDFDDCGRSWFLYDLASAVSFIEHEPHVPSLLEAWVTGYRTVAALSDAEVDLIPTFVMLRRLLLVAWIGSHADTDTGREMGPEFTQVTCDLAADYLRRP